MRKFEEGKLYVKYAKGYGECWLGNMIVFKKCNFDRKEEFTNE